MNWRMIFMAAVAGLLAAGVDSAVAASELTIISFGRSEQKALIKAYYAPFRQATGIPVKSFSYDGETTELEEMAKTKNTIWDVIQVESGLLQRGCESGLFEKLDYARIGSKNDFIPGAVSDCGVGLFAWSMALTYDSERVKGKPGSWADFWDVARFPGQRGLRRTAKYTLEIALLADGVAPRDIYTVLATPEGVDRAFHKLDQIKDHVVWWEAAPQPAEFLRAGRMVMTSAYTLWIAREQKKNKNVKVSWDGSIYDVDSWAIPKGTPKIAEAYRFLAFASKPENQKALSEQLAYGPTSKKTLSLFNPEMASQLPSADANLRRALRVDVAFWLTHGGELEKRFDSWAPPICKQQAEDEEEYEEPAYCQDIHGKPQTRQPGSPISHERSDEVHSGHHEHEHGAHP